MNLILFVLALIAGLIFKDLIAAKVTKPMYRFLIILGLIVLMYLLRISGA